MRSGRVVHFRGEAEEEEVSERTCRTCVYNGTPSSAGPCNICGTGFNQWQTVPGADYRNQQLQEIALTHNPVLKPPLDESSIRADERRRVCDEIGAEERRQEELQQEAETRAEWERQQEEKEQAQAQAELEASMDAEARANAEADAEQSSSGEAS